MHSYDVFISYSHKDVEWVINDLLPILKEHKIKYFIDQENFLPGVPITEEMGRGVRESKKTLLVLTPNWVKSEWSYFESLLSHSLDPGFRRRKMIPVLLEKCTPPDYISILNWIDFSDKKLLDANFRKVVNAILAEDTTSEYPLDDHFQKKHIPDLSIQEIKNFVGRKTIFENIKKNLLDSRKVVISSIEGMGGVGKTALAARLANELKAEFHDGILWADIGNTPIMSVLSIFGKVYGANLDQYSDLKSRSLALRSILNKKKVLIVLDNATKSAQVEPFIPGTNLPAILVTTRNKTLFSVREGKHFTLDAFNPEFHESKQLLEQIIGRKFDSVEYEYLDWIADALGHLPLAIDIVANRIRFEPSLSIKNLYEKLTQRGKLIKEIEFERTNLATLFEVSIEVLSVDEQFYYTYLAVFKTLEFSVSDAAMILEISSNEARSFLDRLYNLSLIKIGHTNTFQLHSLQYEFLMSDLPLDTIERHANYFLQVFSQTDIESPNADTLFPQVNLAWEYYQQYFCDDIDLLNFAVVMYPYLNLKGHWEFALSILNFCLVQFDKNNWSSDKVVPLYMNLGEVYRHLGDFKTSIKKLKIALDASYNLSDLSMEADIVGSIGLSKYYMGKYSEAKTDLLHALELCDKHGDVLITGVINNDLGMVYDDLGERETALDHYEEALRIFRKINNKGEEATALGNIGVVYLLSGVFDKALDYLYQALEIDRKVGNRGGEGYTVNNIGVVYRRKGDLEKALSYYKEAQIIHDEVGNTSMSATALNNIGRLYDELGDTDAALDHLVMALEIYRDISNLPNEAVALNNIGKIFLKQNQFDKSMDYFLRALEIVNQIGNKGEKIKVLINLGEVQYEVKDLENSEITLNEAMALSNQIGDKWDISRILFLLAKIEIIKGKIKVATGYLEEAIDVSSSQNHPNADEYKNFLSKIRREYKK
jgi:tetratricopeptide (TPR) repeat protein